VRSIKSPSWIRRLLGLAPVAPPPHVFALDPERLVYGCLARDGEGFRLRALTAAALPPESFQKGLLGGPPRDAEAFGQVVGGFVQSLPTTVSDASLVVPDAWLRVTFSESSELPRQAAQRDEVLRWKLKRLVPFRVDDLRIDAVGVTPLASQEEPRRLLLGFALEPLLAAVEAAFDAAGVRLGRITSRSLAELAALEPPESGPQLNALAVVESDGYTLVFARGGEPVLHRYKATTDELPDETRSSFVARDLKLTRTFVDEHFPDSRLGRVLLAAPPELEPAWLDWLSDGLGEQATALAERHLPPLLAETAPGSWREMAPLVGAARLEIQ
jgi:hypothetical protein